MKIRHVLGPFPLILFASTAFGQDEPSRNPLTLKWGEPIEKQPGLTLLDEKWFPPFDDKLFLPFRGPGESAARTAMAQALVPGTEEWKSRPYLADRGDGIHTSLFGTYVRKNELLVYLFYEYTRNRDAEYKPSELGFASDQEFRAKKEEHEFLIFASYGITNSLAVELESAVFTQASQSRASGDTSAMAPGRGGGRRPGRGSGDPRNPVSGEAQHHDQAEQRIRPHLQGPGVCAGGRRPLLLLIRASLRPSKATETGARGAALAPPDLQQSARRRRLGRGARGRR